MRREDVYAALHSGAGGSAGEERLIDQGAGRMKSHAGHEQAAWDFLEFSRSGDGSERKVRSANFGGARRLEAKHAAVGGSAQIGPGALAGGGEELVVGTAPPHPTGTSRDNA